MMLFLELYNAYQFLLWKMGCSCDCGAMTSQYLSLQKQFARFDSPHDNGSASINRLALCVPCENKTVTFTLVTGQISAAHLERDEHSLRCSTFHQANDISISTFSPVSILAIWAQVSNYTRATSFTSILQFLHSPYTIAPPVSCKKRNRWFLNNQIVKMVRMSKKLKTSSSTAPWCWNWYSSFSNIKLCCLSILWSSWDSLDKNLDKDYFIKICLRQSGCLKISE